MNVTKLSWIGLAFGGAGWAVLLLGDLILGALKIWVDPVYTVGIGQSLILTGIGLCVVDALHGGFGALSRFFDAVLQRSAARLPVPGAGPAQQPAPAPASTPAPASQPGPLATARAQAAAAAPARQPQPTPRATAHAPAAGPEVVERGRLNDRSFQLYRDGRVEVETLLGTRIFANMEEAREFIGS